MRGGPGRVLPSVIVGGLLVGGLALGMGTAAAAGDLYRRTTTYDISQERFGRVRRWDLCAQAGRRRRRCSPPRSARLPEVTPAADRAGGRRPRPIPAARQRLASRGGDAAARASTTGAADGKRAREHRRPRTRNTWRPPSCAPAALPAAAAVAAPPAALAGLPLAPGLPGLGLPAGFAPTALAGGSLPGGLSSSLFGANFGNPALLAGTPLGAAAASLYQPQADSAVTTVSHSEALATGAPRGIGTPTAIAAIALACVVGILVRSRVLRRIARRDVVADVLVDESAATESATEPAASESAATELVQAGAVADHEPAMVRRPALAA